MKEFSFFQRFKRGGSLLRTSKTVEAQVESFLSTVVESGRLFPRAFLILRDIRQ